jgi:hypothetical protein
MVTTTPTNGQMRKTLASQLDRMDQMLDGLSEGLNDAVAQAVRDAVGQAVRAAVQQALSEILANPELRRRLADENEAAAQRQPDEPAAAASSKPADSAAVPPRTDKSAAPAPSGGGVGGAVRRAWAWVCGATVGAALAVYAPVAHAARRSWRALAVLPAVLWRRRMPALEGLSAAAAMAVLAPLAWPPAAAAVRWLAGSARSLTHAAIGLLA